MYSSKVYLYYGFFLFTDFVQLVISPRKAYLRYSFFSKLGLGQTVWKTGKILAPFCSWNLRIFIASYKEKVCDQERSYIQNKFLVKSRSSWRIILKLFTWHEIAQREIWQITKLQIRKITIVPCWLVEKKLSLTTCLAILLKQQNS